MEFYTTSYHGTQFGNQYQYECGIGKCFWAPPGWIFAWMLELDGVYAGKNKINGWRDRNSGGNTIYITPSIWISNEKLVLQLGIGPEFQELNGHQPKQYYSADLNLGYTF